MTGNVVMFDRADRALIAAFAGCSLDESPGSNWVQKSGSLPEYICEIARAIKRGGKTTSQAIAIAVSRVKKWAAGIGVDKDTQAKAAAAVAEWEKLKAKNKARTAAKKSEHTLAASAGPDRDVLNLTEYSMNMISAAWQGRLRKMQDDYRTKNPGKTSYYDDPDYPSSMYVKETWNSFIIVQSSYGRDADLYKVPYTVDDNADVTFGDPVEVKTEYVEVSDTESGRDITDAQLQKMMAASGPHPRSAIDKFLTLAPRSSALHRVLAATQRHA